MVLNYAAFAIPGFFLFLALEYAAHRKKNRQVYSYENSVANISIGIAERLLNLFIAASFYGLYHYIYSQYSVFKIPSGWLIGMGLLLVTDFVWYWYHRLGHEVNLFWGAHIVHHQSEEFNYTVSARITTLQALIRNLFWCVLPLLGFRPELVMAVLVIHGSYSFFTHTQLGAKLKWLESILITPSLHGVHHASNPKYLDKNYGDVFVFWDKWFGTFQQEEERPSYGLTHPLKSRSFLWQHFHYYLEIFEACKRTAGFKNKLRVIFGSPELLDQDIRPYLEKIYLQKPARTYNSPRKKLKAYVSTQIVICVIVLTGVTLFFNYLATPHKLFCLGFILITLVNCGALLEQRRYIYYLEYLRLFILFSYISYIWLSISLLIVPVLFLLLLEAMLPLNKWYMRYVFARE